MLLETQHSSSIPRMDSVKTMFFQCPLEVMRIRTGPLRSQDTIKSASKHRQPLLMEHPLPVTKPRFYLRCLPQPFRQKGSWISRWPLMGTILSWLPWMKPTSERSSQVNWSWWLRMKLSKSYQRIPLTLFSAPLVIRFTSSRRRSRKEYSTWVLRVMRLSQECSSRKQ